MAQSNAIETDAAAEHRSAGMTALLLLVLAATFGFAAQHGPGPGVAVAPAAAQSPDKPAPTPPQARADVPQLAKVEPVSDRKQRFIEFLRPIVVSENQRVLRQRERVLALRDRLAAGETIGPGDREWLQEKARRYRVDASEPLAQARALARKVDIIPPALALAQGALESAWGTSRFARVANNLFGEWCFKPGCGVVPKRRPAQKTYEVEAFVDAGASVRSYIHNLNSHPAYEPLRDIRARARANGRDPSAWDMAAGLINYAAIGERYVEHIRAVMRRNGLARAQG